MKEVVVGVDIGGTNTKIGLVSEEGKCITSGEMSTVNHSSFEAYLKALNIRIDEIIQAHNNPLEIKGIGIGAPDGNYFTRTIENPSNLKWEGYLSFEGKFPKYEHLPIILTNDANAAAIGEMLYGGAKDMKNFVVITVGTGLGSGIVVNGQLMYGHDGFAGELGHVIVQMEGRTCGCGRQGCLETYVSASGIKRTFFELLTKYKLPSKLTKLPYDEITAKSIALAAMEYDPIAIKTFEYTSKMLGISLANLVTVTSPEAIFLFGGVVKSKSLIIDSTKKYMEDHLMENYKNKVELLPSGLDNENVAILGAASLIWNELKNGIRTI